MESRFKYICLSILLVLANNSYAQTIHKVFSADSVTYYLQNSTPVINKNIPAQYQNTIRVALMYYPELSNVNIEFRVRKRVAPLAARPTVWSTFVKPSKRKYKVTISSSTIKFLTPILLHNLSFNAQVGVVGHELSHVSEYNSKRGLFFVELALKHVSKRKIDRFEYATDERCIRHGLGYQLLSWSTEVRNKLTVNKWGGSSNLTPKHERYMNPATIVNTMGRLSIYNIK
ncbi:MAG: hypothetical protein ABL940_09605 [Bacteroidia bacterium]